MAEVLTTRGTKFSKPRLVPLNCSTSKPLANWVKAQSAGRVSFPSAPALTNS